MLGSRDIELTDSTIKNDRIYLSASDKAFFPSDSFGTRERGEKGNTLTFEFDSEEVVPDIRLASGPRLSPRRSFARFLRSSKAKSGDMWRVTPIDDRHYRIEPFGR